MKRLLAAIAAATGIAVGAFASGADLVVYGKIFTSEGDAIVEAFAVKDGRYVYVGDKAGAEAYVEDGKTEVVDYTGRGLVMPGCGNGHAHYIPAYAIQSVGTAMSPDTDVEKFFAEVVPAAVKKARDTGAKSVFGSGWDAMKFPQDMAYRQRLDAICGDLPVYFADEEGHKGLANTILLKAAGIIKEDGTAGKTDIRGGEVVLDTDGMPTGYLKEQAGNCVRSFMDNDSIFPVEMAKESVDKVQEQVLAKGYTMYLDGASTYYYNDNIYKAAREMDEAGDMHIVLGLAYVVQSWMDVNQTLADACDAQQYASAHVMPNWLKLLVDGTVESGTGFIDPVYADGHQGIPNWTEEELTDISRTANEKGMAMHVHALGNKAVRWAINAFVNGGKDEMRNTLVHVYNVDQSDYQRIVDHNIYVTEGMLWHHASNELQADLMNTLPEGLNNHGYPMKSYFDHGINVSSHSDFPALSDSPDDPFGIMEIAVTGVYWAENGKPWWPEELVTREQALAALTINVARQMSVEDERGSVSVGKYADFLLVDKDVLACPVTEIHTAKPAATYFEGKKVFSMYELKEKIDYSDTNNWMRLPEVTKDVDTFYVYPTDYADDSEGASVFADINDASLRQSWYETYLLQGTAYEESSNVFAPYYRQMNMVSMVKLPPKERSEALGNVARTDVFAALDHYFENLNGGRPFVLAAHSQGSVMLRFVLAEYMKKHPEYLDRMVAAYVLGYSVTKEYLEENPHLKFAEKEDDTGVIVSWNTEGPENDGKENIVVLPNAISINPLNWKRDATYASEKENLGGYMYNAQAGKVEIVPEAADAQLNLERGVVITTNSKMAPHEAVEAFGPASYHDGDYCLYFNNIKENADKRIAAYFRNHVEVGEYFNKTLDELGYDVPMAGMPYRLTVKGLPPGLKFDAKTETISGKATKPGVYKVTVSATSATVKKPVTAEFEIVVPNLASEVLPGLKQDRDAYGVVMCGVAFDPGLVNCSPEDGWTVKAAGLPSGLKYDAKTGKITGVPTKAGTYTVTFTATKGKERQTATITLTTEALPAWSTGTFSGFAEGTGNGERGTASMTVTANGKISGKIVIDGTNWTLKADSFSRVEEDPSSEVGSPKSFVVNAVATAGKAKREIELRVAESGAVARDARPYLVNAKAEGASGDGEWSLALWRGMWKDKSTAATAKTTIAKFEGVYTVSVEDGEDYGSGYLSLTVGKNGDAKASGKLADGTSVSATSPLMYDDEAGWFVVLYAAPAAYKGGAFAAAVGFEEAVAGQPPYRLAPVMFAPQWSSRNVQATGDYGEGFVREVDLAGAYYNKLETLRKYYESLRLDLGGAPELGFTYRETSLNEQGRKATTSSAATAQAADTLWQDGTTAYVNDKGAIVVAKATRPVQDRETKEWSYDGANDGGLTLSFTQATGIFKGSYTFWYDYVSAYDETTDKETMAHTSKKVNFEGILVQGEDPKMDGFYLWDATGEYEDPKTGKPKTYKYKQSFPVSLKP